MRTVLAASWRPAAVLASLSLVLPAVGACSASDPGTQVNPETTTIHAVASTTQICDYVTQLASGGEDLSFSRTGADGTTAELGAGPQRLRPRARDDHLPVRRPG